MSVDNTKKVKEEVVIEDQNTDTDVDSNTKFNFETYQAETEKKIV